MPSSKKYSKKSKTTARKVPHLLMISGVVLLALLLIAVLTGATAMQFENRDSFCASCHSEPETQYFQREASNPVDLASFHATKATRCIDCHSDQGLPGRVTALSLGAKDLFAFVSNHYTQPAPLTRKIADGNCLKCHADISQKQDFSNHFHIFLPKWQSLDPNAASCVDCHQAHVTNGDASIGFLNQDTTSQVCQRCHAFAGE